MIDTIRKLASRLKDKGLTEYAEKLSALTSPTRTLSDINPPQRYMKQPIAPATTGFAQPGEEGITRLNPLTGEETPMTWGQKEKDIQISSDPAKKVIPPVFPSNEEKGKFHTYPLETAVNRQFTGEIDYARAKGKLMEYMNDPSKSPQEKMEARREFDKAQVKFPHFKSASCLVEISERLNKIGKAKEASSVLELAKKIK